MVFRVENDYNHYYYNFRGVERGRRARVAAHPGPRRRRRRRSRTVRTAAAGRADKLRGGGGGGCGDYRRLLD